MFYGLTLEMRLKKCRVNSFRFHLILFYGGCTDVKIARQKIEVAFRLVAGEEGGSSGTQPGGGREGGKSSPFFTGDEISGRISRERLTDS